MCFVSDAGCMHVKLRGEKTEFGDLLTEDNKK